jgi:hypothetical protein
MKRQTGYNLYEISTLQMDEVNRRSIYFICMEFDDMYEINLCNEMELNTWMKYIARK